MQAGDMILDDKVTSLEEIARRIMANGYPEDLARTCAESLSVVLKYGLEEPISRRFIDMHIELLENRSKRYWNEWREELLSRLDRLEAKVDSLIHQ
jgi:hypothetical protein